MLLLFAKKEINSNLNLITAARIPMILELFFCIKDNCVERNFISNMDPLENIFHG